MYLFDPVAGRRRRALARDKAVAAGHDVEDFARGKARHAADRLHGAAAQMRAHMRHEPVDDEQLTDRIRSQLGHLVAQPGKIEVHVENGVVTLSGSARLGEVDQLVASVASMLGVEGVDNRLEGHAAKAGQTQH